MKRAAQIAAQREAQRRFAQRRRERNRELIAELKSAPCGDCGGSFPPECMDFDHRPGTTKCGDVADMVFTVRWALIAVEIMKCDLICANCHRIRTSKRKRER